MASLSDAEIDSILFGGSTATPAAPSVDQRPVKPLRGMDRYASQIDAAAAQHGVDPQIYRRLIRQESGGNPAAVSPVGARGLAQFMPGTARAMGITDPHDPAQAIPGGARYLRQQLDKFGGDYAKALAAYNAGPGAVAKYKGVPPFAETQKYVRAILGDARPQATRPTGKKLSDAEIDAILGIGPNNTSAARMFPVPKPGMQLPQAPAVDETGTPEWLRQAAGPYGKLKPTTPAVVAEQKARTAQAIRPRHPSEIRTPEPEYFERTLPARKAFPKGSPAQNDLDIELATIKPRKGETPAQAEGRIRAKYDRRNAAISGAVEVPFSMLLPNMHRILAQEPEKINDGTALEQAFTRDYAILRAGNQAEKLALAVPALQKISAGLTGAAKTKFMQGLARVFNPAQMMANFAGGATGQALLDAPENLTPGERFGRTVQGGGAATLFGGALRAFKIGDNVQWEPSATTRGGMLREGPATGKVIGRVNGEITVRTPEGQRVTLKESQAKPLPPLQQPGTPAQIPGPRPLPGQVGRPKPKPVEPVRPEAPMATKPKSGFKPVRRGPVAEIAPTLQGTPTSLVNVSAIEQVPRRRGITRYEHAEEIAGRPIPEVRWRVDADERRGLYLPNIEQTAREHKFGAAVEVKPREFYADKANRLYLADDHTAGVALTPSGDIVSVFKHPKSKTDINPILAEASRHARTLDGFDINGVLPNLYAKHGFRPAARVRFNREFAPEGWPYNIAGEPDVVLMVKDIDGKSGLLEIPEQGGYGAIRDKIPVFDDWDEAAAIQQAAADKTHGALPQLKPTSNIEHVEPAPAPHVVGDGSDQATGLARQVQGREKDRGLLKELYDGGKTFKPEEVQAIGKAAVDEGRIHPDALASEVRGGRHNLTVEEVGALLEGKAQKVKAVQAAGEELDEALKNNPGHIAEARKKWEEADKALQDFARDTQPAFTHFHNLGQALQAGTSLDTGKFASVIEYTRRKTGKTPEPGTQLHKDLQEMSRKFKESEAQGAAHRKQIEELNALIAEMQRNPKASPRTKTRTIQERKTEAAARRVKAVSDIDTLLKDVLPKLKVEIGQGAVLPGGLPPVKIHNFEEVVKAAPQFRKHVAELLSATAEEAGIGVEKVVKQVIEHFRERGVKITASELAKAYNAEFPKVVRTVSDATKDRAKLRAAMRGLDAAVEARDAGKPLTESQQALLRRFEEAGNIPEEQLTADYLKRREADLQKQLAEVKAGPFVGPKEGPRPSSPEIEKLTDDLKALKSQKGADAARDTRIRQLEQRLAKIQAGPEVGPKFKRQETDAEIRALQEQIKDAQEAQRLATSIQNIEGFVKREQAKLDAGDYAKDPVKKKQVSEALKKAQDDLRGLKARRRVLGEIDALSEELRTGQYRERLTRQVKELSEAEMNERARMSILQREVKRRIEDERTPAVVRGLVKVRDLSRNLQTTLDDSAGRQLWKLGFSDPDIPAKGYFSTFKPSLSDEGAERFIDHLETKRPNSPLYRGRIEFRSPNEFVPDHIIAKWKRAVPFKGMQEKLGTNVGVHNPFAIAERRYNLRLNLARADLFDRMVAQQRFINKLAGKSQDLDKSTLDRIGVAANTLTGKGLSKTDWEEFARKAATVSYAPGYAASEFQSVTGSPFWQPMRNGDTWDWGGQRSGIVLQYAKTIAGASAFYALYSEAAKLSGDTEPVLDFRDGSTTFGQVRIPFTKQWINPIGGAQGWVRLASQLATQKRTNVKGDTRKLTMKDAVTDLLWNKAHPNIGMAAALHGRKDFKGDEYPPRNKDGSVQWWRVPVDLYSPITPRNFALSLLENGWNEKDIAATMLEFNGLGVMNLEKAGGPKIEPLKPMRLIR